MASKAERKRKARESKERFISLAGGESVPQRPTGRDRTHTNKPAEDPRKTALEARCRKSGIPDPKEAARALLGTDMGLVINHTCKGEELADMTEAWQAISASFRNYRLLVIGQTGDPQGAAIGMVPEPMETDPSLRVDLRTIEEKVAAAKSSKGAWDARINALPVPTMKWALRGALNGFMGEDTLWRDKAPTPTGRLAVEALRRVME